MSLKVINREDFDILYLGLSNDNFIKFNDSFIVYYFTTNDLKFHRMDYTTDTLNSSKLDLPNFLFDSIERKHNLNREVTFEEMNVSAENWGERGYNLANNYFSKQNRENKINQIIK